MTRADAYTLVDAERLAQDRLWPRDGRPHVAQYGWCGPHLLLLEEKVARLRSMWYGSKSEQLQQEFAKVAAIAVRALEETDWNRAVE